VEGWQCGGWEDFVSAFWIEGLLAPLRAGHPPLPQQSPSPTIKKHVKQTRRRQRRVRLPPPGAQLGRVELFQVWVPLCVGRVAGCLALCDHDVTGVGEAWHDGCGWMGGDGWVDGWVGGWVGVRDHQAVNRGHDDPIKKTQKNAPSARPAAVCAASSSTASTPSRAGDT